MYLVHTVVVYDRILSYACAVHVAVHMRRGDVSGPNVIQGEVRSRPRGGGGGGGGDDGLFVLQVHDDGTH